MDLSDTPTLVALVAVGVVVLAGMAACLVDLSRRDVRYLPKWAWALVIVLANFPIGAIVYLVVGRVPPGTEPAAEPRATGPGLEHAPPPAITQATSHAGSLTVQDAPAAASLTGPAVIRTHALGKRYGDTDALADVDLEVPRGTTYGLIGPNGAGKTTMLSILAGLRQPTSGTIDLAVDRRALGVLVDTPQFEPWLTAREVVDLARNLTAPDLPRERVDEVLVEAGLGDALDRRNGGFSRGMLQRLGLASCLVGDPEILVLDEPSSALDPAGRREVLDLIGRLAHTKTVLLSTHILSDVQQVCDVVGVIDHGRLRYQGPLAELLAQTSSAYALHVRGDTAPLIEDLRRQPWAEEVTEQAPGRLRLVVSDAARAEAEVPALLADSKTSLVSFYPATDLETAFLELTS
jgi:ABC-2 type transport system ATP-binding protein